MSPNDADIWKVWPESKRPFTRVEPWIFKYGVLARLTGAEAKVLLVLYSRMNNSDNIAQPTLKEISKLGGVSRSSIPRIVENLECLGLLRARRFGNRQEYKLAHDAPEWLKQKKWLGKHRVFRPTAFNGYTESTEFIPQRLEATATA